MQRPVSAIGIQLERGAAPRALHASLRQSATLVWKTGSVNQGRGSGNVPVAGT